jgi:hypothetical protein
MGLFLAKEVNGKERGQYLTNYLIFSLKKAKLMRLRRFVIRVYKNFR